MKKSIYLVVAILAMVFAYPTHTIAQIISLDAIKQKSAQLANEIISEAEVILSDAKSIVSVKEIPNTTEVILFTKKYDTHRAPTARIKLSESNVKEVKEKFKNAIDFDAYEFSSVDYAFSDSAAHSHPFDIRTRVTISPFNQDKQLLFLTIKTKPGEEKKLIAKNVFATVEFNPEKIKGYTLFGHSDADLPPKKRDPRFSLKQLDVNASIKEDVNTNTEVCFIFELTPQDTRKYLIQNELRYQDMKPTHYEKEKGMITLSYTPPKGRKTWSIQHPIYNKVE